MRRLPDLSVSYYLPPAACFLGVGFLRNPYCLYTVFAGNAKAGADNGGRPAGVAGGQLDGLLWLCCRLLRCGPGDGVLHVSLLLVVKVCARHT